MSRGG
ncbi:hypothetical protein VCHC59B1_3438A, partial [Vibrio cholerae HC-59B1]|eukprot:gene25957-biopygen17894